MASRRRPGRILPHTLLRFTILALASGSARAQAADLVPATTASDPAAATTLPAVTVTGNAEKATTAVKGYRAKNATTATKTDTPLIETPQSVTVVTQDQMVDQGATGLQDALNYAVGVRSDAYGLDSRTDSVRIRGGYPDEYLDGLRKNFEYYTSNARTDPYTLERIEVLRGPAAILYGQGSTGGVVNMVSKRPLEERRNEIGLQVGTRERKQVQADSTGRLTDDGRLLYRLVGVWRESGTQVDYVPDDRALFAPSLTWRPTDATSWTFQALYQKDKTGSTSQFFPWSGTLTSNPNGRLPTSRFIGDPDWDRYDTTRKSIGWLFEHRFGERWTLRQNLRYVDTSVDYLTLYGDSFTLPGDWAADPVGKRLFGRFADGSITNTKLFTVDQHVQGQVDTGPLGHTLLVGLDFARYHKTGSAGFDAPTYAGGSVPLIDAYDPVYPAYTPPAFSAITPFTQRQTGVYAQDQMRLDDWRLTLGLRHDRAINATDGSSDEESSATTKRFGLLYAAVQGWSPFVSYSESFTPLANILEQRFKPLRGKQWEVGVKFEPPEQPFSANIAAYDLREINQLRQDPLTNTYEQLGATRAKGIELEVRTTVARALDVIANYNYTHVDDTIEAVPAHLATLWGRYRFAVGDAGGFSIGAGARYQAAFHDGEAPLVPSVTLFDALLAWESRQWRLALNVNNFTDRVYIATCLRRGDCWYGSRRSVTATTSYRF